MGSARTEAADATESPGAGKAFEQRRPGFGPQGRRGKAETNQNSSPAKDTERTGSHRGPEPPGPVSLSRGLGRARLEGVLLLGNWGTVYKGQRC